MILVFDMDDTLYDELSYVRSGFAAVARFLAPRCGVGARTLLKEMLRRLEADGRGRVFDDLLKRRGIYSQALARRCVGCYRAHRPAISLWPSAKECLQRHAHLPIYIVTDGNVVAQRAKARALGLHRIARRVLLTHHFGVRHAKPSPYCFQRIAQWEGVRPEQVVYVADNPAKDFAGIRRLGFRTVRVLTGQHAGVAVKHAQDAELTIRSLEDLEIAA